jgi:hypothetical protein
MTPGAEVPRSSAHDVLLIWSFQASVDTIKNTTKELHNIAAQYTISKEAAQLHPASTSSREASLNVVIQYAEEGTTGGKKR